MLRISVLAVLTLALAGCGGDGPGADPTPTQPQATVTATVTDTPKGTMTTTDACVALTREPSSLDAFISTVLEDDRSDPIWHLNLDDAADVYDSVAAEAAEADLAEHLEALAYQMRIVARGGEEDRAVVIEHARPLMDTCVAATE